MKRNSRFLKMTAKIDIKAAGLSMEKYRMTNKGMSFGSYCFRCKINGEEKDISFDWDSYVANVEEDGTLLLQAGVSGFFSGPEELSDWYDEEYEEEGFSRFDITAEILANTSEIEKFVIDYDDDKPGDYIRFMDITFEDSTGIYSVSKEVLSHYNKIWIKEYIENAINLNDYDLGGVEITDEDIESICICAEKNPHLLPSIVDDYLYDIRDVLDAGLEELEDE